MKQLAIGDSAEYDLNGTALPGILININAANTNYVESGVAHHVKVVLKIGLAGKLLTGNGNITVTPLIGTGVAAARPLISHIKTKPCGGITIVTWATDPIPLTAIEDTLRIKLHSDDAGDTDITVVATVVEVGSALTDANGNVIAGDVLLAGGATLLAASDFNAEKLKHSVDKY